MTYRNCIGGRWLDSDSGATFEVRNPADDQVVDRVPLCGASETLRAVLAASEAAASFQSLSTSRRTQMLRAISQRMLEDRDQLSELLTAEQGKPLSESRGEVDYARSYLESAAGEADRLQPERTLETGPNGKEVLIRPRPVGVVGVITPWNFPIAMLAKKMGPAFALGCPLVVKPAEDTPLTTLLLARICEEVGVPPGVLNVVTGMPAEIGGALMSDSRVRMVSLTGSTATGRRLVDGASQHLTRLLLELGGHAPFIVLQGCDLDSALDGLMASKFRNGGQTCVCPNRILVPRALHDRFVEGLRSRMECLRSGRGTDPGVQLGPLINDRAIDLVESHVEDALELGARAVLGGRRLELPGLADHFYAPTLLTGCTSEMLCFREETFGPICPVRAYDSLDEALAIANELPCGLASYVWCGDRAEGLAVAERLESGIVGINDPAPVTASTPFGGIRESGWGHEGGEVVLHEYAPPKTYSLGTIASPAD